jgi:hypothetical protein
MMPYNVIDQAVLVLLLAGYLLGLLVDTKDGSCTFLQQTGEILPHYMV